MAKSFCGFCYRSLRQSLIESQRFERQRQATSSKPRNPSWNMVRAESPTRITLNQNPKKSENPTQRNAKAEATRSAAASGQDVGVDMGKPLSRVVENCVRRWFRETVKEAMAGDMKMHVLAGQMYYSGYGVDRDPEKGRRWLERPSRLNPKVWELLDRHPATGWTNQQWHWAHCQAYVFSYTVAIKNGQMVQHMLRLVHLTTIGRDGTRITIPIMRSLLVD